MKIKTSELIGPALDWTVAKATDHFDYRCFDGRYKPEFVGAAFYLSAWNGCRVARFSTDWFQGGPLLDLIEGLYTKSWLESNRESKYQVSIHNYDGDWIAFGPTLLIAAMRCYVANKLGDEVDIPDEIIVNYAKNV